MCRYQQCAITLMVSVEFTYSAICIFCIWELPACWREKHYIQVDLGWWVCVLYYPLLPLPRPATSQIVLLVVLRTCLRLLLSSQSLHAMHLHANSSHALSPLCFLQLWYHKLQFPYPPISHSSPITFQTHCLACHCYQSIFTTQVYKPKCSMVILVSCLRSVFELLIGTEDINMK